MTSFAFILGVLPLVIATGAGASARKSIGITVFSGMIASTCLAVLFVPSFFVVVQRFEEWRKAKKGKPPAPQAARRRRARCIRAGHQTYPRHPEEAAKWPARKVDGHRPGRASFETR